MKKPSKKKPKVISDSSKFTPKQIAQYAFFAVAVAVIGFALYLTARFGVPKPVIDALLRYKLLLLAALVVPLAWKIYDQKFDGFVDWLIAFALFLSGSIIAIHFLFPLLPAGYWPIMTVAPIVVGLVVAQLNSSYTLMICLALGVLAAFGATYLATFDLYLAGIVTIPVVIGLFAGNIEKSLPVTSRYI